MNLKSIATLAAAVIASSAWAGATPDKKCGAGSCGKKEALHKAGGTQVADAKMDPKMDPKADPKADGDKEAACSKKEAGCSKKDPGKDAGCSKKDASCAKK